MIGILESGTASDTDPEFIRQVSQRRALQRLAGGRNFNLNTKSDESDANEHYGNVGLHLSARDADTSNLSEWALQMMRESRLQDILNAASGIYFEDGMDTPFSEQFTRFVQENGIRAIDALQRLSEVHSPPADALGEALRWVGRIEQPSSWTERRAFLMKCLEHPSYLVRDGAISGLSLLDDPTCSAAVHQALLREEYHQLRDDLQQLLEDLETVD